MAMSCFFLNLPISSIYTFCREYREFNYSLQVKICTFCREVIYGGRTCVRERANQNSGQEGIGQSKLKWNDRHLGSGKDQND
jgi:hypothetical protein